MNLTDDDDNLAGYVSKAIKYQNEMFKDDKGEEIAAEMEREILMLRDHIREQHQDMSEVPGKDGTNCVNDEIMAGSMAIIAKHTESRMEAIAVSVALQRRYEPVSMVAELGEMFRSAVQGVVDSSADPELEGFKRQAERGGKS